MVEQDRPVAATGYVAGFDGLRALGLLVMLAYHHGIGAARGGIFTVSMFFTLSGYLIATLTLAEWSRDGRVSLRRFWERRARRLLPAAAATLAGVVLLQARFQVGSGSRFRGDVLAALGYGANWRFAAGGGDYGAIFRIESPVQHFWSLAVEEQFYLAFPLLFVGLLGLARQRWRLVGVLFAVGAAASFVLAWWTAARYGNSGLAYYATYTRAGEILLGVALAFAVATRRGRDLLHSRTGSQTVRLGGALGLVGMAWLWHRVGLTSPAVFRGGTLLNAVCTGLVVLACTSATPGRLAQALGVWPLRRLGRISYGVYLVHWPLFLLLDKERTGLGRVGLFGLRLTASIGLAVVSYHLLEAPFRFRWGGSGRRLVGLLAAPAALLVVVVLVVPVHRGQVVELTGTVGGSPAELNMVIPQDGARPAADVLLVGDSVSWTMQPGLRTWNADHPDRPIHVDTVMAMGCTLAEAGPTRFLGQDSPPFPECQAFRAELARLLAERRYDVVVVQLGHKDLGEREVAGAWRHLGDAAFDAWMAGQVRQFADLVAGPGVPVLWATLTHVHAVPGDPQADDWSRYAENDPARVDRLNALVAAEIGARPGFAALDVAGWLSRRPGGEFNGADRSDGVHWSFDGSDALAAWVVPQVLQSVSRAVA